MKANRLLFLVLIAGIVAVSIISSPGCANIVPPTGGPRDSLPPTLVMVRPVDSTRGFNAKKVTFTFDEYVQLDNVQQNLLVSPVPKINPAVEAKLRTVTVTIKDTLEPSTTYTIDFGNAIKDINEGNVLKNFTYLFTTGSHIDSLQLSGKVIIAETGKTDSTLIVMLHTSMDDSAVIKEKPRYVARLNGNGNFTFHNLPSGTFALYALKDEGGQRRYLSKSSLFAFADSPVVIQESPGPITLYAYTAKEEEEKKPPTTTPGRQPRGNRGGEVADNRLRISNNLSNNELDILGNLELSFQAAPLKTFDSSKVLLTNDSLLPLTGYHFIRDTGNKKITLVYNWQENTPYNLILGQEFAEDTAGRKLLKDDTLAFRTKKASDYGLIRLRLLGLDISKNPVLQFVQGDQVKYSYPLTSRDFYAKLFPPGEYDLRILFDENKNGVWDPGVFFGEHKQPEKVMPLSRKLTIKANWDNEVDINLESDK